VYRPLQFQKRGQLFIGAHNVFHRDERRYQV
jgi:hypothetical protein